MITPILIAIALILTSCVKVSWAVSVFAGNQKPRADLSPLLLRYAQTIRRTIGCYFIVSAIFYLFVAGVILWRLAR